ncbi:hypothetical protein Hanom_Chr01g00028871 [Helianthus anomalus]
MIRTCRPCHPRSHSVCSLRQFAAGDPICSLRQFAVATGFYTDEELIQDVHTTAINRMPEDELIAWWPTIGEGPYTKAEEVRSSEIRDPLVRYLHRYFSTGIAARGKSCEHVTKANLFYLYCLFTGRPCPLHLFLRPPSLPGGLFCHTLEKAAS